jgi:hypothetical protein
MPWRVGMTEGTISGAATGKSTTRYDLITAGEVPGGGGSKAEIRFQAIYEHRILL